MENPFDGMGSDECVFGFEDAFREQVIWPGPRRKLGVAAAEARHLTRVIPDIVLSLWGQNEHIGDFFGPDWEYGEQGVFGRYALSFREAGQAFIISATEDLAEARFRRRYLQALGEPAKWHLQDTETGIHLGGSEWGQGHDAVEVIDPDGNAILVDAGIAPLIHSLWRRGCPEALRHMMQPLGRTTSQEANSHLGTLVRHRLTFELLESLTTGQFIATERNAANDGPFLAQVVAPPGAKRYEQWLRMKVAGAEGRLCCVFACEGDYHRWQLSKVA